MGLYGVEDGWLGAAEMDHEPRLRHDVNKQQNTT
jgi:hypothetical protein